MRVSRLCLAGSLAVLIVVVSLAACIGQDQPRYGGTFVSMLNPSEVITLDPMRSSITDAETGSVIMQIHRGLVMWTPELSVEPALAESWEISEDGIVYTFHLRHGASFQNGREVIAQDCKYSFERLMNPNRGGISVYLFNNVVGADEFRNGEAESITGIEVVDNYTLRITLKKMDTTFITSLSEPGAGVVPSEEVEAVGDGQFGRNPVGAGPFMLESWIGDTITLKAFEGYYGGRPYLDTLVFRVILGLTMNGGRSRINVCAKRSIMQLTVMHMLESILTTSPSPQQGPESSLRVSTSHQTYPDITTVPRKQRNCWLKRAIQMGLHSQ